MKCKYCGENNLEGSSVYKKCGKSFKEEIAKEEKEEPKDKLKEEKEQELYCKCGQKLEKNWQCCPNCQRPIPKEAKQEESEPYAFLYILAFYALLLIGLFLKVNWVYLIAFLTIIVGKIHYPKNELIKGMCKFFGICFACVAFFIIIFAGLFSSCPG